jgi:hypothetical protein
MLMIRDSLGRTVRYEYTRKNHKRTFGLGLLIEADEPKLGKAIPGWRFGVRVAMCQPIPICGSSQEPKVPKFPVLLGTPHLLHRFLSYHFAVARRLSFRHCCSHKANRHRDVELAVWRDFYLNPELTT